MKIYHVEPIGYYGTSGWIVIADSPERAIQLVLKEREIYISDKMGSKLEVYELGNDSTKEFISPEFLW